MNPVFTLELTAQTFGGDAIGRLSDGKAIFIPFGIQGETVEVEVIDNRNKFARGRIVRVLEPSPTRIQPRCPHFTACGGCHYQHLAYADQLALKQGIVKDQLKRIGKIENPPLLPIVPSPIEWNYRNTVQFHLSRDGKLGFQRVGNRGILEINECHLPISPINALWPTLELDPETGIQRAMLRCGSDDELLVGLECERPQPPEFEVDFPLSVVFMGAEENLLLSGEDFSLMQVKGRVFQVSASSFFQANLPIAEAMVDHVINTLRLEPNTNVIDAYCGVGLFSAFLAPRVKNLTGIEISESACNDFATNLDEYENVSLYVGAVEEILPALEGPAEIVVLDPPRAGLEAKALQSILKLAPKQIAYVSCDPSTLARDLQKFLADGYTLKSVTPFDQFPQTYHIETISILTR